MKKVKITTQNLNTGRNSLEIISDNFSKKDFELNYEKYLEFLDFLSEIATLPKNKNSTW